MIDTTRNLENNLRFLVYTFYSVLVINNTDAQIMYDLLNGRCASDVQPKNRKMRNCLIKISKLTVVMRKRQPVTYMYL